MSTVDHPEAAPKSTGESIREQALDKVSPKEMTTMGADLVFPAFDTLFEGLKGSIQSIAKAEGGASHGSSKTASHKKH